MAATLSNNIKPIVDRLFNESSLKERQKGFDDIAALGDTDKANLAKYLIHRLKSEQGGWNRAWTYSALASINQPDAATRIAEGLNVQVEKFEWTRYWAVIALARIEPPNLKQHLSRSKSDQSPLVRAISLRVLIDKGLDESCADELLTMLEADDTELRWAACRAFRRFPGLQPLPDYIETRFLPQLTALLNRPKEYVDVRFQAARALGGLDHSKLAAISALGHALRENDQDWVRKGCVDSLDEINAPECKDALLHALKDDDAEIRVRAARALKHVLGSEDAVNYVVQHLLNLEEPSPFYVDALRQIDNATAASVLTKRLLHPDPTISGRASRALTHLGGEEAVRTLQAQRTKALDTYTKLLGDADTKIMADFEKLMDKARLAFSMSMGMHGAIFAIGVVMLGVGLYFALSKGFETFERFVGVGAAASSLATLLALFYRDPLKNIRHSVTNLVQVNVIFSGYIRQINQTDATFKQLFLAASGFGLDQMKETVNQIQDSVVKTMEQVKAHLSAD